MLLQTLEGQTSMSSKTASWKLSELLTRAGIEERAFRHMRSTDAVDPPSKNGRAARYGDRHLAQVKRVLDVEQRLGLSRSAACELVGLENAASRRSPDVQSRNRAAAAQSFKGTVRCLMPGVFLVYQKQPPGFEMALINEATLIFRKANQERIETKSASTRMSSTIYRANRRVGGG